MDALLETISISGTIHDIIPRFLKEDTTPIDTAAIHKDYCENCGVGGNLLCCLTCPNGM